MTQQSSVSVTAQRCFETLLAGGTGTIQALPERFQYSAQVLECSCAVWGVQRKGTAVKPDLLDVCYA